jgi:hypothetical protein
VNDRDARINYKTDYHSDSNISFNTTTINSGLPSANIFNHNKTLKYKSKSTKEQTVSRQITPGKRSQDHYSINVNNILEDIYYLKDSNLPLHIKLQRLDNYSNQLQNSKGIPTTRSIGLAFSGLKKLNSNFIQVRKMLAILNQLIITYNIQLTSSTVSYILYGMHKMSNNITEVNQILTTIYPFIQQYQYNFSVFELSMTFYGLQNMFPYDEHLYENHVHNHTLLISQRYYERIGLRYDEDGTMNIENPSIPMIKVNQRIIFDILILLTEALQYNQNEFTGRELCNILYGLQHMDNHNDVIVRCIEVITEKIRQSKSVWNSRNVGMALYGLQNFRSDCSSTRLLLLALVPKIRLSHDKYNQQLVGMSMYGLRKMSSAHEEVNQLIQALIPKIEQCDDILGNDPLSPLSLI